MQIIDYGLLFGTACSLVSKANIPQILVQSYRIPSQAFIYSIILIKQNLAPSFSIYFLVADLVLKLDRSDDVESAWPVNLQPGH